MQEDCIDMLLPRTKKNLQNSNEKSQGPSRYSIKKKIKKIKNVRISLKIWLMHNHIHTLTLKAYLVIA
jgi:hypothetical protein